MTGWLTALGSEGTALSLLILGHVLADFTFQTDESSKIRNTTFTWWATTIWTIATNHLSVSTTVSELCPFR